MLSLLLGVSLNLFSSRPNYFTLLSSSSGSRRKPIGAAVPIELRYMMQLPQFQSQKILNIKNFEEHGIRNKRDTETYNYSIV